MNDEQQEINPFQSPETIADAYPRLGRDYFVAAPFLLVKSGSEFPARCIHTNQPVQEADFVNQNLRWTGKSFQLVLVARFCTVRWAISKQVRRRRVTANLFGFVGFCIFMVVVLGNSSMRLVPQVPAFFVAGVIWMVLNAIANKWRFPGPQVVGFHEGYFRIRGLGEEFLNSLEEKQAGGEFASTR